MDTEQTTCLMNWDHWTLADLVRVKIKLVLDILLQDGIITGEEYEYFLSHSDCQQQNDNIILLLSRRCSVAKLIYVLKMIRLSAHEDTRKQIWKLGTNIPKTPGMIDVYDTGKNFIELFHDKTLQKVLSGNTGDNFNVLKKMLSSYREMLQNKTFLVKKRRSVADSCFVLMDALTVKDRVYSSDISNLSRNKLFHEMKSMIAQTSNPQLTSVWYYSRYGVALALGNECKRGLDYIHSALQDARLILKMCYLGNCIFAYVNIMLQTYNGSEKQKTFILGLIEWGIDQFQDESEELRNSWRHVYLVKKAFCLLRINVFLEDIPTNKDISASDKHIAGLCIEEMKQTLTYSNARRKIHYLKAKSKLHFLENDVSRASGSLLKAVAICDKGGFVRERETMMTTLQLISRPTARGNRRLALQHDESI